MLARGNPPPPLEAWSVPDRVDIRVGQKAWKVFGAIGGFLVVLKVVAAVVSGDRWESPSWIGRALPIAALSLVWAGLAALALWRCAIRITPEHLIVRGLFRTRSFPWGEILAINGGSSWIEVTTRAGTFGLPWIVVATAGGVLDRVCASYPSVPALMATVQAAWVQRRGPLWHSTPLDPWSATRTLEERIILRRPWAQWPTFLVLFAGVTFCVTTVGTSIIGYLGFVLVGAVGIGTFGVVNCVVDALVIDPEALVVRTVLHTRRIPRADILQVTIEQGGAGARYAFWGPARRMLVQTSTGWVSLPAPVSGGIFVGADPLFLRKAAWLEHELRAPRVASAHDASAV